MRRPVALGEEVQQATFDVARGVKVIWGQYLLLQQAKDNLNLVQPGGVHRQPMNVDGEGQAERANPRRQLLGGVGRPIVEDQMEDADASAPKAAKRRRKNS